jgi:hypothetical protein
VNGTATHVNVIVADNAANGATTSAFTLPIGYIAKTMNVLWTCENGKWAFTDASGACLLATISPTPAPVPAPTPVSSCLPQISSLLCSINGTSTRLGVAVNANAANGATTSTYTLPQGYIPTLMNVSWTCENGTWTFADASGACFLTTQDQVVSSAPVATRGPAATTQLNWLTAIDSMTVAAGGYHAGLNGSPDFMNLFQIGVPWSGPLSKINVVKLYTQAFEFASDADLTHIFTYLNQNNIALAIEYPPISSNNASCFGEGVMGATNATIIANRIKRLGGTLSYVAMDEPLDFYFNAMSTNMPNCPFSSIQGLAQNVAKTYFAFKDIFPNVQMGDIECYFQDVVDVTQYATWFAAFKAATGVPLAFFHDDAMIETNIWQQRTPTVRQALLAASIPYGLIRNGYGTETTDIQWMAIAESRVQIYNSLGLPAPDQNVFQTWAPHPTYVLPQTSPTSLTFLVEYLFPPVPTSIEPSSMAIFSYLNNATGDYYFASSQTSIAGYTFQGVGLNLFTSGGGTRQAIYSCLLSNTNDHFLSNSSSCEGQIVIGLLGYSETSFNTQAANVLYRCVNGNLHMETISGIECQDANFIIEGPLGYTP